MSGFNCHGSDIRGTSDPEVFLTLNAVASISILGGKDNTKVRNLILNWIPPTLGKDQTDWVGLFKKDVDKAKTMDGECVRFEPLVHGIGL